MASRDNVVIDSCHSSIRYQKLGVPKSIQTVLSLPLFLRSTQIVPSHPPFQGGRRKELIQNRASHQKLATILPMKNCTRRKRNTKSLNRKSKTRRKIKMATLKRRSHRLFPTLRVRKERERRASDWTLT